MTMMLELVTLETKLTKRFHTFVMRNTEIKTTSRRLNIWDKFLTMKESSMFMTKLCWAQIKIEQWFIFSNRHTVAIK